MEKTFSSKPRLREFFAAGLIALACLSLLLMGSHGGLLQVHAQAVDPSPPSEMVKLVFIHHSCGDNWLDAGNGNLGDQLGTNNYYVSDTYYGWGPDSIGDNTDIGHWWTWFRGPSSSTYTQAVYDTANQHGSYTRPMADPGGENEIIMFKSCYPNSNLGNPTDPPTTDPNPLRGQSCGSEYHTVANAKGIYNDILEYFATRQDKLFVVITAPPVQSGTYADNARAFNTWLVEDWLDDYPYDNVAVFDFYNVLTSNGGNWYTNDFDWETGNHHRYRNSAIEYITDQGGNTAAYPNGGSDNHPSAAGNQKATGEFISLLNIFYHRWESGQSTTTYYVRPDGGSPEQCTGLVNAPYPGSGTGQPCAWDHPFRALPPEGTPRIAGGDTLIIGSGSYMMGYSAPGADNCSEYWPWGCHIPPIPSGPDPAHPTRILGEGWDAGCSDPPELWGTERAYMILNLTDASNVEIACLEITDHSSCVEFHTGGLACERDTYPFGDWAAIGLYAEDSANVHLNDLNIHGLAHAGVWAGRLSDWTVEDVRIAGNGWVGWDGDIYDNDSNSGTLLFRRWTVEWNGCGETYPGGDPTGCWAQTAGGYGDGVGTGATGGDWVIEDSAFLHNTSDGLDLLYVREEGSSITIRRTIAEGNAGNQIKASGPVTIENSILVGNCGFFDGQPFTYHVDNCRALGTALPLFPRPGNQASVVNSTITSEGDCLVIAECDGTCDGSESVLMRNNIFQGHPDFLQPYENTCLTWTGGFPHDPFDIDYSIINDVKHDPCPGPHDICGISPGLVNSSIDAFDAHLLSDSSAIDTGTADGAPEADFDGHPRPLDGDSDGIAVVDIGAYEFTLVGDLDYDCDVDTTDIMLVASRWHVVEGDDDYDPLYDPNNDGEIDIVDIMLVAIHWGENCTGSTPTPTPTTIIPSRLIQPADLVYEGAFAYPSGDDWAYSGHALAHYPEGDPTGPADGYPGSLYAAAHPWYDLVGEITIPEPVISDNFDDLPEASVLRSLTDITEGWKDNCTYNDDCIYREVDGLEYLPNINKIVWNLRDWYNVGGYDQDSLGWSDLDMTGAQGVWHIGERGNDVFHNAKTCNYLFKAPESFASENLDGKWLIAGSHREAGAFGGSQGPTLYALAPWEDGNPPEPEQNLDALALLYYPEIYDCVWEDPNVCHFPDYRAMDNWGGGAWVQTANRSGILIFGRKGLGDNCYGTQEECGGDSCVVSKGYHAYPYEPQILFYDPGELKEVIAGTREPWEVVPYEVYSPVNEVIDQECAILGAVAYDQERGLIYVTEQGAGPWGETVVHVWEVRGDI